MLLFKRVSKKFQKISCLCFILWFAGMIVPSSGYAMNQGHHQKTVLRAFQLLDDLGLSTVREYYEGLDYCLDPDECLYVPRSPIDDDFCSPAPGVADTINTIACEAFYVDDYLDLSMCEGGWGWWNDCQHIWDPADADSFLWFVDEPPKNLTSILHFVNVEKDPDYNDPYDGYYCDAAYPIQWEEKKVGPFGLWDVDKLMCWWLGDDGETPGIEPDDTYMNLDEDDSALYRYTTPFPGLSIDATVELRFGNDFTPPDGNPGDFTDVIFPPVSNMARYWYSQFIATSNPIYLGPVLHAATDAVVPHHATGYAGNWHTSYEDEIHTYYNTTWGSLADIEEAMDKANEWITDLPYLLGTPIQELVNDIALTSAPAIENYFEDDYTFNAGSANDLQSLGVGRAAALLYRGYVQLTGDTDTDGYPSSSDNCPQVPNPSQSDDDGDDVGNACDNCVYVSNYTQWDSDEDTVGNACDMCDHDPEIGLVDPLGDGDHDLVGTSCDNCVDVPNPDQWDTDEDLSGDACDPDLDGDGVLNKFDNCAYAYNPGQEDCDDDGKGAACDGNCPGRDSCIPLGNMKFMQCGFLDNLIDLDQFDCLDIGNGPGVHLGNQLPNPTPDPDATPWNFPSQQYGSANRMIPISFCETKPFGVIRTDFNKLSIWDMRDPLQPILLGAADVGVPFVVERFKNFALVGKGTQMDIWEISTPGQLRVDMTLNLFSPVYDIDTAVPYAYATTASDIIVVDMRNPLGPGIIKRVPNTISANKAAIKDDLLFLISKTTNKMEIYSLATPTNPQKLSTFQTKTSSVDVEVQDNFVYLAENQGIEVVNISDPKNPIQVNWIPVASQDARRNNSRSSKEKTRGPQKQEGPTKVIELYRGPYPTDLSVHPGGLFAVTASTNLAYYDLSSPANPVYKMSYPQNGQILAITEMGDYTVSFVKGGSNKIYSNNMNYPTMGYWVSAPIAHGGIAITGARFNGLSNMPKDTHVNYYYSGDGGANWLRTEAGMLLTFEQPILGDQFFVTAVLGTGNPTLSPRVWDLNVLYTDETGVQQNVSVPMFSRSNRLAAEPQEERFLRDMEIAIEYGKVNADRDTIGFPPIQEADWAHGYKECRADPATAAYVSDSGSGQISVLDLASGRQTIVASGLMRPAGLALNPAQTTLYINEALGGTAGELSALDLVSGVITVVTSGFNAPDGLFINRFGTTAYVVENGSGELSKVNLSTGAITTVASGFTAPRGLAVNSTETTAYVVENGSGEISAVDLRNGAVTLVTSLPGAVGIAITPDDSQAYVTTSNELFAVDLGSGIKTLVASGFSSPQSVTINFPVTIAYVAEYSSGELSRVDLASGQVSLLSTGLGLPRGVTLNIEDPCVIQPSTPPTAYLVEQDPQNGLLTAVNLSDGTKTPIASGLAGPSDIVLNSAGTTAYVTEGNSTKVSSVDIESGVVQTITSSVSSPYGIALDNNGGTAYVTELYNGRLVTVEISTGAVIEVVSGLSAPKEVELDPSGAFAYVVEAGSDELSKVDIARKVITVVASGIPSPRGLAINADGTTAYVTDGTSGGNLWAVDIASGTKTLVATGLVYPEGVTLNAAETTAYVTSGSTGQLMSVDIASGTVTTIASGLMAPRGVDVRE